MTAAAKWGDGTIVTVTGTITRGNSWTWFTAVANGHQIGVIDQGNGVDSHFTILGGSGVVEWAALYEGSYTADTLPAYQPKGYAEELVECQRYYNVINPNEYLYQNSYAGGYTVYSLFIQFPKMRIIPTIQVDGNIEGYNHQTDSSIRVYSTQPNSIVNSVTLSADL